MQATKAATTFRTQASHLSRRNRRLPEVQYQQSVCADPSPPFVAYLALFDKKDGRGSSQIVGRWRRNVLWSWAAILLAIHPSTRHGGNESNKLRNNTVAKKTHHLGPHRKNE
jgi:hypothetical protein